MRLRLFGMIATVLAGFGGPILAEPSFEVAYAELLAKARIADAAALARDQLTKEPGDRQAAFALGAAQFLAAVEGLGQGFYRHGLTHPPAVQRIFWEMPGLSDLPFLRLPVPENPKPEPFSVPVLRQILSAFDEDLGRAETTLAQVPKGPVRLPLDAAQIRLDLNNDGQAQDLETLTTVLYAISGIEPTDANLAIVFDESDVPWLRGYSHLLQGITDILLAHDWTEAVEQTFQSVFPRSQMASDALNRKPLPILKRLAGPEQVRDCGEELPPYEACRAEYNFLDDADMGDLVAFVHLFHWPVVEPARLIAARQHFVEMIALSRENWALIRAETDDDHEWVPNTRQKGPFAELVVSDEVIGGWMEFLDQAEAVLDGRLLIPHWRFPADQGLNIRKMFEEPRPLDPILLITGSGAIPYIETGPTAPGSTMDTGIALIGGGLLAYLLWFN